MSPYDESKKITKDIAKELAKETEQGKQPEKMRLYSDTATWNIEAYQVKEVIDPVFVETAASRAAIQEYAEEEKYCGMSVFFDNINKEVYVWISAYAKKKGWVKKFEKVTGDKFDIMFREVFESLMKKIINDYKVYRVDEGQETEKFEWLFMYEVAELSQYKQHYPKTEYQEAFNRMEEEKAAKETSVQKCENCGWLLAAGKTACPKCGHDPTTKKGEKSKKDKGKK